MGIMDIGQWAALATVAAGILTLVAHSDLQTRRLRTEMHAGFTKPQAGLDDARAETRVGDDALRAEIHAGLGALRSEAHASHDALRTETRDGLNTLRTEMRDGFNRFDDRLQTIEQRIYDLSNRLPAG